MSAFELAPLTVAEVGDLFRSFNRPWWLAGGWALDLYLGRETRDHADVEVVVLRRDQDALRAHLRGWEIRFALNGKLQQWRNGQTLALPIHELWARRDSEAWNLEVLLDESSDERWIFRRDARVTLPLDDMGAISISGPPVLAPEIVLLYKARRPAAKDESDFQLTLPHLNATQRAWLRSALDLTQPGHRWADSLTPSIARVPPRQTAGVPSGLEMEP